MTERKTPTEQKAEGMADKAKGKAKEAYGAVANDTSKRMEGQKDQAKGEAKKQTGKARENLRENV